MFIQQAQDRSRSATLEGHVDWSFRQRCLLWPVGCVFRYGPRLGSHAQLTSAFLPTMMLPYSVDCNHSSPVGLLTMVVVGGLALDLQFSPRFFKPPQPPCFTSHRPGQTSQISTCFFPARARPSCSFLPSTLRSSLLLARLHFHLLSTACSFTGSSTISATTAGLDDTFTPVVRPCFSSLIFRFFFPRQISIGQCPRASTSLHNHHRHHSCSSRHTLYVNRTRTGTFIL